MSVPALSFSDLALAAMLILANAALSLWLSLAIARDIAVAAVRAAVQLLLVGLVLKTVFESSSLPLTLLIAAAMFAAASYEVGSRQERRLAGWWGYGLGAGTMVLATTLVTLFALFTQFQPQPWYAPHTAIPMLGIVLGSVMNGVSQTLSGMTAAVARERNAIEARLALGCDRATALRPLQRRAIRSGLIPIVNQMSAAGLITLPGMMTGQVLAGMDPVEAAKYQILILFLLAGGAGLGAVAAAVLATRRLTDERHRLRLDRLAPASRH